MDKKKKAKKKTKKKTKKDPSAKKPGKPRKSKKEWTFKDWYVKNAENLNEKRKHRYKNDPDYRRKILDAQRKRRAEARKNVKKKAKKHKAKRVLTPRVANIKGAEVRMLSTGQVLELVGVTKVTLLRWLKKGFIPSYFVRDDKNRRWFPIYYVEWLRSIVEWREEQRLDEDRKSKSWFLDETKQTVLGRWINLRKRGKFPTVAQLQRVKIRKLEKRRR